MPSILRHLYSDSKSDASWERILSTLRTIAPHVEAVTSSSLRTGKEFVEFRERVTNRGIESWESSDGTLRALAILLALETSRSGVVLIEEPEQNLHPWAVRTIVEHIRAVIEERKIQVILTTHSQQVLERAHPSEVLVVSRKEGEGTKFQTLQQVLPNSNISMGEVGELWVQGLLGGVPSYD
jgi:predicted ATPase